MVGSKELIEVVFTSMQRKRMLFDLLDDGTVIVSEDEGVSRQVGRIPEEGEPWERDFHEFCATWVHTSFDDVLMTLSKTDII